MIRRGQFHAGNLGAVGDVGAGQLAAGGLQGLQARTPAAHHIGDECSPDVELLEERQFAQIDIRQRGVGADCHVALISRTEDNLLRKGHHREIKVARQ